MPKVFMERISDSPPFWCFRRFSTGLRPAHGSASGVLALRTEGKCRASIVRINTHTGPIQVTISPMDISTKLSRELDVVNKLFEYTHLDAMRDMASTV